MPLNAGLLAAAVPNTAIDYQNEAAKQQLAQQLGAAQIQAHQAQAQAAQDEMQSKRRGMAISMLNGIAQEQDPAKQASLYATLKPMAERYDPSLKLPDAYDPVLGKALFASQISPDKRLELQIKGQGDLPSGYRFNPQTGQAELIPGVDPSFGKKADPYLMPMPVQFPDGNTGFATKRDVVNNPTGYKPPPSADNAPFKRENTLRDEFNTLTKDFRTVQDAYSKITSTSDNGAGDMSLLYSYVKLLDPGSVVRESEFATAAASGSFGERVQGAVKSIVAGGRLPPSLRQEFITEAGRIYAGQKAGYDRTKQTYTDISTRAGADPKNVINDYAATPAGQRVSVITPDGTIGTIDAKDVDDLLAAGGRLAK